MKALWILASLVLPNLILAFILDGLLDCQKLSESSVFKRDLQITRKLSRPPTTIEATVYANLCGTISSVEGCARNSSLCTVERFEHKGDWIVSTVKSYAMEGKNPPIWSIPSGFTVDTDKNGTHSLKQVENETFFAHQLLYEGDWGQRKIKTWVEITCDNGTETPLITLEPGDWGGMVINIRTSEICEWEATNLPSVADAYWEHFQMYLDWRESRFRDTMDKPTKLLLIVSVSVTLILSSAILVHFNLFRRRDQASK